MLLLRAGHGHLTTRTDTFSQEYSCIVYHYIFINNCRSQQLHCRAIIEICEKTVFTIYQWISTHVLQIIVNTLPKIKSFSEFLRYNPIQDKTEHKQPTKSSLIDKMNICNRIQILLVLPNS